MPEMAQTADDLPSPYLEEVSPGIYAYIQLDGTWGLNNTGFLTGRDAVSVVDTCFTEARTRAFLQAIDGVTDLPIRTLVNTHHHGDHTHGNYLVKGASIVGHELCRQTVIDTGIHTLRPLFPNVVWGDLELAPPFITFLDRLDLFVDDLKLELHYMGPAHTTNDVMVWLPERKLMFTGDLAFNGGTPFVAMGSIAGSIVALERLHEFDADIIVPGHGPVCGTKVFDEMAAYLRFVQERARETFAEGLSPLEAAQHIDLGEFAHWHDSERLAGNLHRAYSEIRGEPHGTVLDLGPIAEDMIAYNGGQPVRCLA
jgi:cyclase